MKTIGNLSFLALPSHVYARVWSKKLQKSILDIQNTAHAAFFNP